MSSQNNAFDWKNAPSETGASLGRTQTAPKTTPKPLTYSKRNQTSSIASAQPLKRKPGTGRSASV